MYKLPEKILKDILIYLQTKPYQEVAGAIQILSNLEKIEDKKVEKK